MSQQETRSVERTEAPGSLAPRRLGVWAIVFFVVSAAAPLTVVASAAPTGFRIGGIGGPGAMLAAGVVLILFSVGFTAMTRYVRNAGAFYIYGARGLGKPTGIGIALLTIFSYGFLCVCFYGFVGFFGQSTFKDLFNVDLPWWVYALVALVIVGILGYRHIDVGAKVLATLLTAEVLILLILAVAVLINGGPEPISFASFAPQNVFFAAGSGALFVFGFGAYLGFEGTAIYTEEAKNPKRTVPAATYIAITFLAVFYAFTFWMLTVAFGANGVLKLAAGNDFQDMVFNAAGSYLGAWASIVMRILIVTSFFACLLAFHNACSRYLFSMGRERLLPRAFARTHGTTRAPHVASLVLTVISLLAIVVTILTGTDPFLGFALPTYSIGVAGLVFAQAVAAISVVGFFARNRRGHSVWRVIIAPALGALGLIVGFVLIATNFDLVTGLEGPINWILLLPTPVLFIGGIIAGFVLKAKRPQHYAELTTIATGGDDEANVTEQQVAEQP
ncbi:APC family permease [Humibacter ginsenosidimutans]|uniref:APC family permease n=1 Tax=Humibacter ginsenosidimutans TaxID=2599293 RepID=A0A5B8M707_9MICO|nr:APC family permease [Humibacter ginsenosidimutans]QDZ16166.1 APC family permease [Humibacter ginsenosidimutans]